MDPLAIPEWIRDDPEVEKLADFHLPTGSGISGPPAGAYLVNVRAENAIKPLPMWHVLFEVTDEDLETLDRSRVLVMACSVVPIFQLYPLHRRIDGTSLPAPDCREVEWCSTHQSFQINEPYVDGADEDPGSCWRWEMAVSESPAPLDVVHDCAFVTASVTWPTRDLNPIMYPQKEQ